MTFERMLEASLLACVCVLSGFSRLGLFVNLWTIACQAAVSVGFSRQEYWSELPCPSQGDIPNPGIKPQSLMFPALAVGFFTTSAIWEAHIYVYIFIYINIHKLQEW